MLWLEGDCLESSSVALGFHLVVSENMEIKVNKKVAAGRETHWAAIGMKCQ